MLTPSLRARLTQDALWAGAGPAVATVLDALDGALAGLPSEVAGHLLLRLGEDPEGARATLAALTLAQQAGFHPVSSSERHVVVERDEVRVALASLHYAFSKQPRGRSEDVARLLGALDATFQGRQYAVYLRRAVPAGFDPTPVGRAAHLWLGAIDRGEWKGRHAIYEDDDVALELTLVQQRPEAAGRRVVTVGPLDALDRLADVDTAVVELAERHAGEHPDLPLVVALAATPGWRLPRGYVEQLLYGTAVATEVSNGPDGTSYVARFRASGRSLFSDSLCGQLGALWWLDVDTADPLAFRAWVTDNPWCEALDKLPTPDVRRFAATSTPSPNKSLTWRQPAEQVWRIA